MMDALASLVIQPEQFAEEHQVCKGERRLCLAMYQDALRAALLCPNDPIGREAWEWIGYRCWIWPGFDFVCWAIGKEPDWIREVLAERTDEIRDALRRYGPLSAKRRLSEEALGLS